MTKQSAIKLMEQGQKMTHPFFTPWEWIIIDGNDIVTEEGYRCSQAEFWGCRGSLAFDDGWFRYKG